MEAVSNANIRFATRAAILSAIDYLDWHLILALAVALAMTMLSCLAGPDDAPQTGFGRKVASELANKLAFALFGVATAYFMSLGIDPDQGANSNTLLTALTPPAIALLTGGVTYLASKDRHGLDRTTTGVATFLAVCVLSYQAFAVQISG